MRKWDDVLEEKLKDKKFKAEYDALDAEYQIKEAIIKARRKENLTQQELANRTGINKSDISRLEHGNLNPSIKLLKRLAKGLNMTVKIKFVPEAK